MTRRCILLVGIAVLVGADDPAPEAFLETKGIVRRSAGFVLQSEDVVKTRLRALNFRVDEFDVAYTRFAEIQWWAERLDALDQQMIEINAAIAELNFQLGRVGNNFGLQQQIKADRDARVRYRDTTLVPERDTLRKQQPIQRLKPAFDAAKLKRESMLTGLIDVREVVVATNKGYEELAKDTEVQQALRKLGQTKFGPSAEFLANAQSLGQFEKLLGQKPTVLKATSKSAARKKPRG